MSKPNIHEAAESGDLSLVQDHVTSDPSCVDRPDVQEFTPLMWSAWKGHTDVCRLLLENAADVNARHFTQRTPLVLSAEKGHTDVCRLLLENAADVNARDNYQSTPLIVSAEGGFAETCLVLVASKADVAARDRYGCTALKYAIDYNKADVAAYLRSISAPE